MPRLPSLADTLTAYTTNVIKRWAEAGVYDRLARSPGFERLKGLSPAARYALEAGLSFLGAVAQTNLPERSPAQRVAKALATDAPAELSKRLLNGDLPGGQGGPRD